MLVRMMGPADATLYRSLRLRALREHPDAFTSSYEQDRDQPVEIIRAGFEHIANETYAGVVHQNIEPAVPRYDLVNRGLGGIG